MENIPKVFICVPLREGTYKETKKYVKDLWKNNYPEYELLDPTNGIAKLSEMERLAKHLKMISKANIIVFGKGWDTWAECILIKRICDVYDCVHIEYDECADNIYDMVLPDTDSYDYDSVGNIITALCKVPARFQINISGIPNHYDDWIGLGVNYEDEVVDITDRRNIEIIMDEIASLDREVPIDKKNDIPGYDLTDLKDKNIKMFLVDINIRYLCNSINGVFYTDRINRSNFDDEKYDVFDVSGFSYDDWDCPIKVSKEKLVDDYESFEFIGTLVVEKGSLKSITDNCGCFYIDGESIIWKLGIEIH